MAPGKFRLDWPLALLAAAIVVPLYWPSLRFDLFNDDYLLLRPWPPEHLVGVLTGPWFVANDPDYYRPVAIYIYKAMFWTFGLNTRALHVIPLVTMTVLAWLVGRVVRRETGSLSLGAVASGLYAIHPITVAAVGPWIVNQYQGVVSLMVLLTLLWWQRCRDQPWPHWIPLVIPITIGAFTKETGLMIPLMIIAVHSLRAWWLKDVRHAGTTIILAGAATFVGLNLWRLEALGTLHPPLATTIGGTVQYFLRGPFDALFEPRNITTPWWKYVFGASAAVLVIAAGHAVVTRARNGIAALAITGLVILFAASVPTSLVYSRDRLTPHGTGAVLLLTAGAATVWSRLRGRWRTAGVLAAAIPVAVSIGIARDAVWRFEPCNTAWLENPAALFDEPRQPPPEMVRYLRIVRKPCEVERPPPFFRATSRITWGVSERATAPGVFVHTWIRPRVVALLDHRGTSVIVELRHPRATVDQPIVVELWANPADSTNIALTSGAWTKVELPLTPGLHTWLRQMHRLEMRVAAGAVPGLEMRPLDVVY